MATFVNNPVPAEESSSSALGLILTLIILIALAVAFFVFGLPYLRSTNSGTQINVPEQVDVNVNQ